MSSLAKTLRVSRSGCQGVTPEEVAGLYDNLPEDFRKAMEGLFAAGVLGVEGYGRAGDHRKKIVQTNEVEL